MAQCMYPYYVSRKFYFAQGDDKVPVPCGKCPECLKRRTNDWALRLTAESKRWSVQHFITLTYENPPMSNNGFMTLRKSDLQKFFKRLRKKHNFRYYGVGEYGSNNKRPHYHVILLADAQTSVEVITKAWLTDFDAPAVAGLPFFGTVEEASIRYTIGYYDKGDWYPQHKRDDRDPEFSVMSKNLGLNFLTSELIDYIVSRPDKPFLYHDGFKVPIPRYFTRRIFDYCLGMKKLTLHPSFLLHRDEMLQEKQVRNLIIKKVQDEKEQPELTEELHEARRWAIINYRREKRKSRD